MRIRWESIDGFRPTTRKHIPQSEYAALDRAIAQKNNNALLLLKDRPKPLTPSRIKSRLHQVKRRPKIRIPASVYVRHARTSVSRLESAPFWLIKDVSTRLSYASMFSLALCSSQLLMMAREWQLEYFEESGDGSRDGKVYQLSNFRVSDHIELMNRLDYWMPSHLKFCHHCLIYVPRSSFDLDETLEGAIICMDCQLRHNERLKYENSEPCHGCFVQDRALSIMDSEMDQNNWGRSAEAELWLSHDNNRPVIGSKRLESYVPGVHMDDMTNASDDEDW